MFQFVLICSQESHLVILVNFQRSITTVCHDEGRGPQIKGTISTGKVLHKNARKEVVLPDPGSNLRPPTCESDVLPLSYAPQFTKTKTILLIHSLTNSIDARRYYGH